MHESWSKSKLYCYDEVILKLILSFSVKRRRIAALRIAEVFSRDFHSDVSNSTCMRSPGTLNFSKNLKFAFNKIT